MNQKIANLLIVLCVVAAAGLGLHQVGVFDAIGDAVEKASDEQQSQTVPKPDIDLRTSTEPAPPVEPEPAEPTPAEPTPDPTPAAPDDLYDAGALKAVTRQLVNKLGYSPQFVEIVVSSEYAQFSIQNKSRPNKFISYQWRDGSISGPDPMLIPPRPPVKQHLFTLRQFNADALPRLRTRAQALKIGSPEVSTTIIHRFVPFSTDIRFFVNVTGTRASKQLRADARGRFEEVV